MRFGMMVRRLRGVLIPLVMGLLVAPFAVPVQAEDASQLSERAVRVRDGLNDWSARLPDLPPAAMRSLAASATLSKSCEIDLGTQGGLRWFLTGAKDDLGPFGAFQFFDPDQVGYLELGQFFADLQTVRTKKLNSCRLKGDGDWGTVNVRTNDPGQKKTERAGCIKYVWKNMRWDGKVVFKAGRTRLGGGKVVKRGGKLQVLKVVQIDGCIPPDPPPTDCDVPVQLFATDPGSETDPAFSLFATKDTQGIVVAFLIAAGMDAGLEWVEFALASTEDADALSADKTTMTGTLEGFGPLNGTATFNGTASRDEPVDCGGTITIMDGLLTGDGSAQLLMGSFSLGGTAQMGIHNAP